MNNQRARVGGFDTLDVSNFVSARAFKKTGGFCKRRSQYGVQSVLGVRGGDLPSVVKCYAGAQSECERETVFRALNVRSQLRYVIKLFVFLHQRVEDQCAHAFAGSVN